MALTQDQSALLTAAVENLNQSVEVNKQVLEIVKGVGNTGAVDIATHNNDASAHSNGLSSFLVKDHFYVKTRSFTGTDSGNNPWAFHICTLSDDANKGNCVQDMYARLSKGSNIYNAIRFRNAFENLPFVDSDSTQRFGTFLYQIYENSAWTSKIAIEAGWGSLKKNYYYSIGVIDATTKAVTTVYFWSDALRSSKPIDLGEANFQFKDIYLQNSPIVSSDERLKQDIEEVPEAVFKAWARVKFKQYRFKEAVASKGDEARKHVGLIAQHILAAFEAEGLDATAYGIVCHDSWEDQYENGQVIDAEAVFDENGNVVTPEKSHTEKRFVKAAGDVWTVRYEEALALETAYQRWRLAKIEAALEAKGITL